MLKGGPPILASLRAASSDLEERTGSRETLSGGVRRVVPTGRLIVRGPQRGRAANIAVDAAVITISTLSQTAAPRYLCPASWRKSLPVGGKVAIPVSTVHVGSAGSPAFVG